MMKLCLASTSRYRHELLSRLGLKFEAKKPLFDEDLAKHELTTKNPIEIARALAFGKASSVHRADQITLGSDQLVSFQGNILGKTPTPQLALEQLTLLQGKTHELITAVCLLFGDGQSQEEKIEFFNLTKLTMRPLNQDEIQTYLDFDEPYDCAGTYKIEKRGISLFEKIETTDFTAIQGLPLLQLTQVLRTKGFPV